MTAKSISLIYQVLKSNYEQKYDAFVAALSSNADNVDSLRYEASDAIDALDEFDRSFGRK